LAASDDNLEIITTKNRRLPESWHLCDRKPVGGTRARPDRHRQGITVCVCVYVYWSVGVTIKVAPKIRVRR